MANRFALSATDPAGDQQDEELKGSGGRHGRRTIAHPDREGARTAEIARDRILEHYTMAWCSGCRAFIVATKSGIFKLLSAFGCSRVYVRPVGKYSIGFDGCICEGDLGDGRPVERQQHPFVRQHEDLSFARAAHLID